MQSVPRRIKVRPRLESLETRALLSGDVVMSPQPVPTDPAPYVPSQILVRFRPDAATGDLSPAMPGTNVGKALAPTLAPGLRVVTLDAGVDVKAAVAAYQADSRVEYAQPNYILTLQATPNDPKYLDGSLWNLHNTGQSGGTPGADIGAPAAWDLTGLNGGSGVTVAVIDTGVDYTHPDLVNQMWVNPGEIPGDGIDNNGDGYVDDVHGYDFVNNDGDPMDDNNHGTHVAGSIAAEGNNGIGVIGVAPGAKIMALKFLDASGSGSDMGAIEALDFAVSHGATISNNSYAGAGNDTAFSDAIAAAGLEGHIFVAASGNSNQNTDINPDYPSSFDLANIISVAATTRTDDRASFSNYGAVSVDLGAPGASIVSTVPKGGYASMSGTSMATPQVVGALALIRGLHPSWTYEQVIDTLLQNVDPIPALSGKTVTGGRLDAAKAVSASLTNNLLVTSMTPTPSGVSLNFSRPLDTSVLNLYGGTPDLTLVGASSGPVTGSLAVAPDGLSATFVRSGSGSLGTSGLLPNDTYTLTLRSAIDGFVDPTGLILDGNDDGNPGDDYVATFDVANAADARVLSIPDIVRGPGQSLAMPTGSTGLPVQISDGTGLTDVSFELHFDPTLLDVTGIVAGADASAAAGTVTYSVVGPGDVTASYSGPTLGAGPLKLFRIVASVPADAPYFSKEVLQLSNVSLNSGAIDVVADSAVHSVSFLGDTNGNRLVDAQDVTMMRQYLLGSRSSFPMYPNLDPAVLADVNQSGAIDAQDATRVRQFLLGAGLGATEIPPTNSVPVVGGPDPLISIPRDLQAGVGATVTVPVNLKQTDVVPVNLDSVELVVGFDPSRFSLQGVKLGSLDGGFDLSYRVDEASGLVNIVLTSGVSGINLSPGVVGSLAQLDLRVLPSAMGGSSALNLRATMSLGSLGRRYTALNGGNLVLSPAPTDSPDDPVDGRVRVVAPVAAHRAAVDRTIALGDLTANFSSSKRTPARPLSSPTTPSPSIVKTSAYSMPELWRRLLSDRLS